MSAGASRTGSKGSTCRRTSEVKALPLEIAPMRDSRATESSRYHYAPDAPVFKPNVPVLVENPYEALKDERGSFEVVSPAGDIVRVSCRPGQPLSAQWIKVSPESQRSDYRWRVTRISEDPDPAC